MTKIAMSHVRDTADVRLDLGELHASLAHPLLESMNFLNEIVSRYPRAISFAPGRPYEESFEPR